MKRKWVALVALALALIVGAVVGLCWLGIRSARGAPGIREVGVEEAAQIFETVIVPGEPIERTTAYNRAVCLYNRAEYGTTGDITEEMAAATNYTVAHAAAEAALLDYIHEAGTNSKLMAYILVGECRRREGDHRGSIEWYDYAVDRTRRDYEKFHGGVNLAYALLRCKGTNEEKAREVVDSLLASPRVSQETDVTECGAIIYRRLGFRALQNTDYPESIRCYEKAVELRPGWPGLAKDLAVAYTRLADVFEEYGEGKAADSMLWQAKLLLAEKRYERFPAGDIQEMRDYVASRLAGGTNAP